MPLKRSRAGRIAKQFWSVCVFRLVSCFCLEFTGAGAGKLGLIDGGFEAFRAVQSTDNARITAQV